MKRTPRADVIPGEVSGHDEYSIAPLQDTNIDGNRRHVAKESMNVVGVRVQSRCNLRRQSTYVIQKIPNAPNENARIPQAAILDERRRTKSSRSPR